MPALSEVPSTRASTQQPPTPRARPGKTPRLTTGPRNASPAGRRAQARRTAAPWLVGSPAPHRPPAPQDHQPAQQRHTSDDQSTGPQVPEPGDRGPERQGNDGRANTQGPKPTPRWAKPSARSSTKASGITVTCYSPIGSTHPARRASTCRYVNAKLKRQRYWQCPSCTDIHERNQNAAVNLRVLLDETLALLPSVGGTLRDGKALAPGKPGGETGPDDRRTATLSPRAPPTVIG